MLLAFAMKKRPFQMLVIALLLAFVAAGCARQPTQKKSTKLIQKYFKKYAHNYPETPYKQIGLQEVQVTGQQEIHKGMVAVESFLTLKDGSVQRINATIERGPLGWKCVSWENATEM